jgi:hypothetical protein
MLTSINVNIQAIQNLKGGETLEIALLLVQFELFRGG